MLSPFFTNRSSLEQSAKGESDFVANYPQLGKHNHGIYYCYNSECEYHYFKNSESLVRSKQRKTSLDRAGKLTTPGMDSLRERLHAEGATEDSAALITNARRSGINAHYESAWRKWHSWCSQRQVDPIKCSVNKILQFLAYDVLIWVMYTVKLQGLGQQSRHTMTPLMEFQLGKNGGCLLFWQVFIILDLYNLDTHLFEMSRKSLTSSPL